MMYERCMRDQPGGKSQSDLPPGPGPGPVFSMGSVFLEVRGRVQVRFIQGALFRAIVKFDCQNVRSKKKTIKCFKI